MKKMTKNHISSDSCSTNSVSLQDRLLTIAEGTEIRLLYLLWHTSYANNHHDSCIHLPCHRKTFRIYNNSIVPTVHSCWWCDITLCKTHWTFWKINAVCSGYSGTSYSSCGTISYTVSDSNKTYSTRGLRWIIKTSLLCCSR